MNNGSCSKDEQLANFDQEQERVLGEGGGRVEGVEEGGGRGGEGYELRVGVSTNESKIEDEIINMRRGNGGITSNSKCEVGNLDGLTISNWVGKGHCSMTLRF